MTAQHRACPLCPCRPVAGAPDPPIGADAGTDVGQGVARTDVVILCCVGGLARAAAAAGNLRGCVSATASAPPLFRRKTTPLSEMKGSPLLGPGSSHRADADHGDSRGHLVGSPVSCPSPGTAGVTGGPSSLDWAIMAVLGGGGWPLGTVDPRGTSHKGVWIALITTPTARLRSRGGGPPPGAIRSVPNVVMETEEALPLLRSPYFGQ
jgi:hypothetical protein